MAERSKMSSRTRARKRALDVLFAAEARRENPGAALDQLIADGEGPANPYSVELVRGVVAEQARIDELLSMYSEGWTLDRMPAVDRNVLRIGVWELLFGEIPEAVAVTEAMNLVRELSTDESPAFVNGVLGGIGRDRKLLLADAPSED